MTLEVIKEREIDLLNGGLKFILKQNDGLKLIDIIKIFIYAKMD